MLQVLPHDEAQPEPKMNRRRLLGATATAALLRVIAGARGGRSLAPGPVMAALSAYMAAAATRELPATSPSTPGIICSIRSR
jgi:hypothetical protein